MYAYDDLLKDVKILLSLGYTEKIIAQTVYGRRISAFVRGEGAKILVVGATHAREHVTAKLVVDLAKRYDGENVAFIPMLNPDGVELAVHGIESAPVRYRDFLRKIRPNEDFSTWKANGRGVDINVNYNAGWGRGRTNEFAPSYQNYVGEYPESETESRASADFVRENGIKVMLTYHAKGEVIYWSYNGVGDMAKAKKLSVATGYDLAYAYQSHGGFKDWFLENGFGHAYTVEVGKDDFSYIELYKEYGDILSQNQNVLTVLEEMLYDD